VDYLAQHWDDVSGDLLGALFSGSGLVWFGGLVGGALGVILWARWRGFLEWRLFDACAPALALGYAVGRIGCQLSGDGDYGEPTDMFWGMAYPDGTVPTTDQVHPTPVFETVAMAGIALLLWRLRDRYRPGLLFGLYLLLAGLERLLIEFIRRNDAVVAGLTQPQLIGLAMMVGGALLVYVKRRPAAPAPQAA
jgi:phosphatidylglycerol:prolipoprotein diacylglycerol transferase